MKVQGNNSHQQIWFVGFRTMLTWTENLHDQLVI